MSTPEQTLIRINIEKANKSLSRAQKQFNRLSKDIATERQRLRDWQDIIPKYQQQIGETYAPLQQRFSEQRTALVLLLDAAYDKPEIKAAEKKKLKHLISGIAEELLSTHDDEKIKAVYNKYSATDFDTEQRDAEETTGEMMKTIFEGLFDMDLGEDVDLTTPEKAHAAFTKHIEQERARDEQRRQERKKTAKQLEKETRQREEEQNVSKSIQEVFRKLAGALHPDRETDPSERDRKTELMQRVNVAYGKRDLLQLLELQLQVEQIDQTQLNNIAENRLQYFNKVLKQQLNELREEIVAIEAPFKMTLGLPYFEPLSPKQLLQQIKRDVKELRSALKDITHDLEVFGNIKALKAWLKTYKIPKKSHYGDDDFDLFDPFEELPF